MATDPRSDDQAPLVRPQGSLNDAAEGDQPTTAIVQQPLALHVVLSFEDAFRNAAMAIHPNTSRIEINGPSRTGAIQNVGYHLKLFGEPRSSFKILTDVRTKEYTNTGAQADTVEMSISKKRETCHSNGFRFSLLQGLQMGDDHRIGPSIFNEALTIKNQDAFNENDSVSEKLNVPPHTKTTVMTKTHLVKYEGEATIVVQAAVSSTIRYKYVMNESNYCCGPTWKEGAISMGQLFRGQPGYWTDRGYAYYTATYYYMYFGEQFGMQKTMADLGRSRDS